MSEEIENRKNGRQNTAYISIKYKAHQDWEWSKAHGWNEAGFNFLAEDEFFIGDELEFKKALNVFVGQVQWKQKEPDLESLFHMAINRMIAKTNEQKNALPESEMVELLRSADLGAKLEFARTQLGLSMNKETLKEKIEQAGWDQTYCYGVLCEDEAWVKLVNEVREQLSDADGLDLIAEQFDRLGEL